VLTSADAVSWTLRNSGTTAWLNDVKYVDGTYYIVGNQGTLLTSDDAVTWTSRDTITGKSLSAAATLDGQLVAVGVEGVILRAQAGPFPKPIRLVQWPASSTNHAFLASGQIDQRFHIDRTKDLGGTWTDSTGTLEISDTAGTLLLLDNTANDPVYQFFKATEDP
jgi:photosystem II stability/assembly factor-like uncharacterized protein